MERRYIQTYEKWKPNKAQREEYRAKMQDTEYVNTQFDKKVDAENKRREKSRFNYRTAGGKYIPSKQQYDFTLTYKGELTDEQSTAFFIIQFGYINKQKVNHDYIHIVNELIRSI